MRKVNGILSGVVLVLFLIHGILGAFQLIGAGNVISKALSYTMLVLIVVHAVISMRLTVDAIRVQRKTGAGYFRRNMLFWARRISGILIMVMIFFHTTAFAYKSGDYYRLAFFNQARLISQILLVASVAVHLITNIRPMLITFGIRSLRSRAGEILFILSVLLVFMAAAFIVYYLRWNRF